MELVVAPSLVVMLGVMEVLQSCDPLRDTFHRTPALLSAADRTSPAAVGLVSPRTVAGNKRRRTHVAVGEYTVAADTRLP